MAVLKSNWDCSELEMFYTMATPGIYVNYLTEDRSMGIMGDKLASGKK